MRTPDTSRWCKMRKCNSRQNQFLQTDLPSNLPLFPPARADQLLLPPVQSDWSWGFLTARQHSPATTHKVTSHKSQRSNEKESQVAKPKLQVVLQVGDGLKWKNLCNRGAYTWIMWAFRHLGTIQYIQSGSVSPSSKPLFAWHSQCYSPPASCKPWRQSLTAQSIPVKNAMDTWTQMDRQLP